MGLRNECDKSLTSQLCFCSECFAKVEHSTTAANYSLQICDVNIGNAFAFAGSMNRAYVGKQQERILVFDNYRTCPVPLILACLARSDES